MTTLKTVRLTLAALALSLAATASAQNITGQVVGWVTDAETGKAISGATVTATSPGWIPQTVRTDSRGYYVLSLLPPERYEIQVQAPGFEAPLARTAVVMVDWRTRNDVRLLSTATSSAAPSGEPIASR